MKKHLNWLLLILLIIGISSNVMASEDTEIYLIGSINNKIKIHMNLQIDGSKVTGTYYYDKYKINLQLQGRLQNDILTLDELDPKGQKTGSFTGKMYFKQRINGTWQAPDGSRQFPFYVYTEPLDEAKLAEKRQAEQEAMRRVKMNLSVVVDEIDSIELKRRGDYWALYYPYRSYLYCGLLSAEDYKAIFEWEEIEEKLGGNWQLLDYEVTENGKLFLVVEKANDDSEGFQPRERKVLEYDFRYGGSFDERRYLIDEGDFSYDLKDFLVSQDGHYLIYLLEKDSQQFIKVISEGRQFHYLDFPYYEELSQMKLIALIPDTYSFLAYFTRETTGETILMQANYQTSEVDYFKLRYFIARSAYTTPEGEVFLQGEDWETGKSKTHQLPYLTPFDPEQSYLSQAREAYFGRLMPEGWTEDGDLEEEEDVDGELPIYNVSTAEELFDAIGSNRIIELAPGTYNLTSVTQRKNTYIETRQEFDGPEWLVHNVKNLVIRTKGADWSELIVTPTYANVLSFKNVSNVTIEGVYAGHSTPGTCWGPVFTFMDSEEITINNSLLFGSGTHGLLLEGVNNFLFQDSTITDCTIGIVHITDSTNLTFKNAFFEENQGYDGIVVLESSNLLFENSTIANNRNDSIFSYSDSEKIIFRNTSVYNNKQEIQSDETVTIENMSSGEVID